MAFEVARVHGIIRCNIREDGSSKLTDVEGSLTGEVALTSDAQTQPTATQLSCLPHDLYHQSSVTPWSDLPSSPLASSSPRSTETESIEDDDLLTGLAEHVAQTMLEDDDSVNRRPRRSSAKTHSEAPSNISDNETTKAVGSPQSSWSSGCCSSSSSGHYWLSCNAASSKGSSRVSSQVSSPPTTPVDPQQSDAWDLLYAAAGEVVRLKMNEHQLHQQQQQKRNLSFPASRYHQQHVQSQSSPQAFLPQQVPAQVAVKPGRMVAAARNAPPPPPKAAVSLLGPHCVVPYFRNQSERIAMYESDNQRCWNSAARAEDCRLFNNHQMAAVKAGPEEAGSRFQSRPYPIHHQHQAARPSVGKGCEGQYRSERFVDYNNAPKWTTGNGGGSGMRAVFLGSGGSGRESSGTGVFLPRCAGNGPEIKRKPACSTVLLPSWIVQVLNLNVDNMHSHPSMSSSFVHPVAHPGHSASIPSLPTKPCPGGRALRPSKLSFDDGWLASCGKACPPVLRQNAAPELSLPSEWTY